MLFEKKIVIFTQPTSTQSNTQVQILYTCAWCFTLFAHICLPGGAGGGSLGGGPRGGGPGGRPGGGPGGGPGGRPGGGPGGRRRGIGPLRPPGIPGGLKNGGAPEDNTTFDLNDAQYMH